MRLHLLLPLFFCCAQARASLQDAGLRLRDHADLQGSIQALADRYPDLVTVETLATSRAGRLVSAVRIAGPGLEEKSSGILLVANLEGERVFSSAVAMDHAWQLAEGYSSDPKVRAFLDQAVVYIVPRGNPDAAEARFVRPLIEQMATGTGIDDDRDGRQGEDPPSDVNGDGYVTWMRLEDPDGEWMEDPADPRVLIEADPSKGQRGRWKLHVEGRDLDGDERVAEDAALDAVVDRNFPAGWEAHEPASGLFPSDEPEARGLMEFILAHPEITLVVSYGDQDNLVKTPKGVDDDARPVKRIPPSGVRESDVKYLKELGTRYREITDSKATGERSRDGRFTRWCYEHRGLWVLSAALWELPEEAPEAPGSEEGTEQDAAGEQESDENTEQLSSTNQVDEAASAGTDSSSRPEPDSPAGKGTGGKEVEPSPDAKKLTWIDAVDPERFLPWKTFEHPELGAVEIGGFAPYSRHEPPTASWAEIAAVHFEYLLTLDAVLPQVGIVDCSREDLGGAVWRITCSLQNNGLLPFYSRSMRSTRTTRPGRLRIELPEGARLLGGGHQVLVSEIEGSGGRHDEEWLVLAPEKVASQIRVTFDSDHAGKAIANPEVKP